MMIFDIHPHLTRHIRTDSYKGLQDNDIDITLKNTFRKALDEKFLFKLH